MLATVRILRIPLFHCSNYVTTKSYSCYLSLSI